MEEIKLPKKGLIGAFFTGLGVVGVVTFLPFDTDCIFRCIGLVVGLTGVILFVIYITAYTKRKRLYSLPEAIEKSVVVWGLWHTGAQVSTGHFVEKGTHIKRILLFDYCNAENLYELTGRGEAFGHESDIKAQIRKLTEQALEVKDEGVEVRWYKEPMCYSIIICEKENESVKTIDDFGNSSWIRGEFLLAKVKRHKRPKFLLEAKGKPDEKRALRYYLEEYQKIWDKARPINSLSDMEL